MSMNRKGFLKVVIIGDSGVGKTSLLESLNYKKISKSAKPTIGAEFLKKKIMLEDGNDVTLQLWDTAGQERFQSLCTSFYRGADCCVLVFDISSPESYESLEDWRQTFINTTGDQNQEIPIIIIGNKTDKGIHVEKTRVTRDWLQSNKAKAYIQASALKYEGIESGFQQIASYASEFQQSLKDNDRNQMRHSVININQLRKDTKQNQRKRNQTQLRNRVGSGFNEDNDGGCGC